MITVHCRYVPLYDYAGHMTETKDIIGSYFEFQFKSPSIPQRIFQPYARILHRSEMESFTALFIAMELIFHCLDRAIVRGKAVSFRGLSLVSRVATSLAVAAGQRLSLSEAVVVYFAASFDCRGEDSLSLADVDDEPATPPAPVPVSVRRSGRVRRAPVWHKDYIM
ncbi:uncharacterized protein [Argopecten irradians]|uniref:uncharacterized protein isoform X1 n=1 Tax=Argopecten irradians TaxID=31199 RepID=UPI00371C64FD